MDPAAISSGIGQGEAQVFAPVEDFLKEALKASEEKKKETAANKAAATKILGQQYKIWSQRDSPYFAKQQQELWNWAKGQDVNDPNFILELNNRAQKLQWEADKSSADQKLYGESYLKWASDPSKHFDDVPDNLNKFASTPMSDFNPVWMVEAPDFDAAIKNLQANARSTAEAEKHVYTTEGTVPGGTSRYTKHITEKGYSLPRAEADLTNIMTNPFMHRRAVEKANTAFKQDPSMAQKYNNDPNAYILGEYGPKIAVTGEPDVMGTRISGDGSGAGGAKAGWYMEKRTESVPNMTQTAINTMAQKFSKDPGAIENYNTNLRSKKAKEMIAAGKDDAEIISVLIGQGATKEGAQEELKKAQANPAITDQENMSKDQYMMFLAKTSPQAQKTKPGFTFDFGQATGGEAGEVKVLELSDGTKIKPNTLYIEKGSDPIVSGLDNKGEIVEVPWSKIHAKLRGESKNQLDRLKQKTNKEIGFDAFSQWENGVQAPLQKRDATGKSFGGAQEIKYQKGDTIMTSGGLARYNGTKFEYVNPPKKTKTTPSPKSSSVDSSAIYEQNKQAMKDLFQD